MQFRLPEQLQNELVAYDPALKALARSRKPKSGASKKSKFPLGQPSDLIPASIIRQSQIDEAIEQINASFAPDRYHIFTRIKNVATPEATTTTFAIIYHYERVWYAAWLPPEGKESDYIYGFSVAYKDTETSRKLVPHKVLNTFAEHTKSVQYGRSFFRVYKKLVTQQDILACKDYDNGWNIPMVASYAEKSRDLAQGIKGFHEQLKKSIPTWEDTSNMFDRIRAKNVASVLFDSTDIETEVQEKICADPNWKPSYVTFQKLILDHAHTSGYRGDAFRYYNKILHIIDKPFFRKWIQERCDEIMLRLNDPNTESLRAVKRPWKLIHEYLQRIYQVHSIWSDCPIDYYQTHINVMLGVRWNINNNLRVDDWLKEHMPVASFFSNLTKFYEKKQEEADQRGSSYYYSTALARSQYRFHEWDDTYSMIHTLLLNQKEVPIPKRWRMEEFHDTIQAEAWKIKNPNETLPQDLFPTPVKVHHTAGWMTFFQPHDTHQLAMWGQAVRNCIGSASSYAEGVRKKKHFLVLCMLDNKPHFTVQLDVNMGMMSVRQIVGLSNSSLSADDRLIYTEAFGEALKIREDELKENS